MTSKALFDEILRLPPEERLRLVGDIWDSLAASPHTVPVPDWHKAELDRRLSHPNTGPGQSLDEVRNRLQDLDKK